MMSNFVASKVLVSATRLLKWLSFTLNGYILKPCDAVKDLGVGLQCNLKPGMHCTEIAHKANTRANLITK